MNVCSAVAVAAGIVSVLISVPMGSPSQAETVPTSTAETTDYSQAPAIRIQSRSGRGYAGYLMDVVGDSVILQSHRGKRRISLEMMSSIHIVYPRKRGTRALFGALCGVLTGLIAGLNANGNPAIYYSPMGEDTGLEELAIAVGFAGVGSALGAWVLTEKDQESWTIGSKGTARVAHRLRRIVGKGKRRTQFHLEISPGFVDTRTRRQAEGVFQDAGINVGSRDGPGRQLVDDLEEATGFNLLRRVELRYTVTQKHDIGLAIVNVGEPALWGSIRNAAKGSWTITQTQNATAYFLTGRTLLANASDQAHLFAGVGIGVIRPNFLIQSEGFVESEQVSGVQRVKESSMAGYLFAGLELNLDRYRFLGIGVDYVIGPSHRVSGNPATGVGDQKIDFGNASVTFSLGIRL